MTNVAIRLICNQRLCPVRDTESGGVQHGQVVGAITHRHYFGRGNAKALGHLQHGPGLELAVYYRGLGCARDLAVADIKSIGIDLIETKLTLQRFGEGQKTTGHDGCMGTPGPQGSQQLGNSLGNG